MIRDREKIVVSRTEGLMKQLKQDIDQLRRSDAELQQLSQTHNHTHFLQVTPMTISLFITVRFYRFLFTLEQYLLLLYNFCLKFILWLFVSVQSFPSLPVPPGSPDVPSISDGSLDVVGKSVSQLRQKLEDFCREKIEKLSGRGKELETH